MFLNLSGKDSVLLNIKYFILYFKIVKANRPLKDLLFRILTRLKYITASLHCLTFKTFSLNFKYVYVKCAA